MMMIEMMTEMMTISDNDDNEYSVKPDRDGPAR